MDYLNLLFLFRFVSSFYSPLPSLSCSFLRKKNIWERREKNKFIGKHFVLWNDENHKAASAAAAVEMRSVQRNSIFYCHSRHLNSTLDSLHFVSFDISLCSHSHSTVFYSPMTELIEFHVPREFRRVYILSSLLVVISKKNIFDLIPRVESAICVRNVATTSLKLALVIKWKL